MNIITHGIKANNKLMDNGKHSKFNNLDYQSQTHILLSFVRQENSIYHVELKQSRSVKIA